MILTLPQIIVFFLIFARIAGLFRYAPIFNDKQVFAMSKLATIFWISSVLIFVIPIPQNLPNTMITLSLALIIEFLIGALIGFVTQLLIIGLELAGSLMDNQAGLSTAMILDPASGLQTTLLSRYMRWIALIMFLHLNGHHMLLGSIYQSFNIIPITTPTKIPTATKFLLDIGSNIFALGIQYSISILLVVFLVDFCFGMLSKVAPQVNVFQLGFQVKPLASIFIFLGIIPTILYAITDILKQITEYLLRLFLILQG